MPADLKTKTFRLSDRTQAALRELSELTGLSYEDLLRQAANLMHDTDAIQELIRARKAVMELERKAKERK